MFVVVDDEGDRVHAKELGDVASMMILDSPP